MNEILEIAAKNQGRAREIIQQTDIINIWKSIGADINLIGSLKLGLLMKHLDIDFHIYTESLNIKDSFTAMSKLSENPGIKHVEYTNLIHTDERCIEWHAWYEDEDEDADKQTWTIDMIHILKGSFYDGYFEKVTDRISKLLTPEIKQTILRLKYETPEDEKIMGIEYYQAVIRDGIRSYNDLADWKKQQSQVRIIEWMP